MPSPVLRCKAQSDQRLHRPLGAQERVEQLEQLIGAPPQAPEELAAEPIQLPHRPALVSPADPVHTVHHGHRRSPWSVATRRIQRWPPSCQARNHAAVTHRRQGLNDKLIADASTVSGEPQAAHVVIGEHTGAASAYVGMTRGRAANTAHLIAEDLAEAREQWITVFGRDRADLGPGHAAQLAAAEAAHYVAPRPLTQVLAELHQAWT